MPVADYTPLRFLRMPLTLTLMLRDATPMFYFAMRRCYAIAVVFTRYGIRRHCRCQPARHMPLAADAYAADAARCRRRLLRHTPMPRHAVSRLRYDFADACRCDYAATPPQPPSARLL